MPATYFLKKTIPVNTLIEMEKDRYWVIERIGTCESDKVTIEVDGIPVAEINSTIAPIARTSSNRFGPLDLGDYYIVVPPERKIYARSATSGYAYLTSGHVYVEGKLIVLSPGEALPAEHLARYNAYATRKLILYDYSATIGDTMVAGVEYTIATITPAAIEDHVLKRRAGVSITGTSAALSYGQVAVKLYYDGKPLDQLAMDIMHHGIEVLKMPLPPTDSTEEEPFTFADLPVYIAGGHTLTVKVVNVSGADIVAAPGQNIVARFMAIAERIIKG